MHNQIQYLTSIIRSPTAQPETWTDEHGATHTVQSYHGAYWTEQDKTWAAKMIEEIEAMTNEG